MATRTSLKHPLLGKLIRIDCEDHAAHGVSRIIADLGNGLMLAMRLSPRTGENLDVQHIIALFRVADETTEIFDDWEAYERENYCPHSDERVVKLVPSE